MVGFLDKFKRRKKEKKVEEPVKIETTKKKEEKSVKGAMPVSKQASDSGREVKKPEAKKVVKRDKSGTGDAHKVLVRPLITEKSTDLSVFSKYAFEVFPKSNKSEIIKAIENVYGVRPIKVNIVNMRGKEVRYGRVTGKTKKWKKAIITLKLGEKIEIYEGV